MTHVLTLIAAAGISLPAADIAKSVGATQWQWLDEGIAADLMLRGPLLDATLATRLSTARIDHILQPVIGREKKLLISDMDSTMIDQECIDELAGYVGMKDHVAAITERAMNGELDFKAALRERVALLKDLPESALQEVFDQKITFMQGAHTLVQTMKARGAYCLLVSGGFEFFTSRVATALGFDANEANCLVVTDGKLTGNIREPILDKESKRARLHRAATERGIELRATLALGDGANDLPMLLDAGLGIAYRAKPMVQQQARHSITYHDLTAALYAQGIAKAEWVGA